MTEKTPHIRLVGVYQPPLDKDQLSYLAQISAKKPHLLPAGSEREIVRLCLDCYKNTDLIGCSPLPCDER